MLAILVYVTTGVGASWTGDYMSFLVLRAISGAGAMALYSVAFVLGKMNKEKHKVYR